MKRAYLLNTMLLENIAAAENGVALDNDVITYLDGLLNYDYCYLVIGNKEIVKVLGVLGNKIIVHRKKGSAQYWPAGTNIRYKLTPNEVQDASSFVGYTLVADGAISISSGRVNYEKANILGWGGVDVDNEPPAYQINDSTKTAGCNTLEAAEVPDKYLKYRVIDDTYTRRVTDSSEVRSYQ